MRFGVLDIGFNFPDAQTGLPVPDEDRVEGIVEAAVIAERLGFDQFSVGERANVGEVTSAPPVLLAAIAARTKRIGLNTGVTILPTLDPVRVAQDYLTADHIARGRVELTIAKGGDPALFELYGRDTARRSVYIEEGYALLRRLLAGESVDWEGEIRPPIRNFTVSSAPYGGRSPRVWHGSVSSEDTAELAARWGDPLFTANAFRSRENYANIVRLYRRRFEEHGHDPALAYVAAGSAELHIADTKEQAIAEYQDSWDATSLGHPDTIPFRTLRDAVDGGSWMIGSPESVAEKIIGYHELFGHDVQYIRIGTSRKSWESDIANLRRFAEEVIPLVNREIPNSSLWTYNDPGYRVGSYHPFTAADAQRASDPATASHIVRPDYAVQ